MKTVSRAYQLLNNTRPDVIILGDHIPRDRLLSFVRKSDGHRGQRPIGLNLPPRRCVRWHQATAGAVARAGAGNGGQHDQRRESRGPPSGGAQPHRPLGASRRGAALTRPWVPALPGCVSATARLVVSCKLSILWNLFAI
jgi:hypothetical protein